MNNNQKMLLGVAVVGVAAYYYWKSQQPKPAAKFVGANGIFDGRPNARVFANLADDAGGACPCRIVTETKNGFNHCKMGHWCEQVKGKQQ
jgi:hypothetical protein